MQDEFSVSEKQRVAMLAAIGERHGISASDLVLRNENDTPSRNERLRTVWRKRVTGRQRVAFVPSVVGDPDDAKIKEYLTDRYGNP